MLNIKDLLYRWLIQKDRLEIQELAQQRGYEQGFNDAQEKYDHKKWTYNRLASEWFVEPYSFLEVSKTGQVFLGGEEISNNELLSIQEEIKYLDKSRIWEILQETLRQKAVEKAMLNSTEWEHVLAGKMMVHSLGVFKSIMGILKSVPVKKP